MTSFIKRDLFVSRVKAALARGPITALLGPRQCGKTTLAGMVVGSDKAVFFDLENPVHRVRLENPMLALESLRGLVVIDEVQRKPDLFPVLRVLADRVDCPAKFLLLGSASPELARHSSETLAGRIEFIAMSGLSAVETGVENFRRLWLRGGMPRSYLAGNEADSYAWRDNFIQTFLERDLGQMGVRIESENLRRFWMMVAHYHGQTWNGSEIGGALGVSYMTSKSYLDIMTHAYVVRQLQPWHENIAKRQVKAPKVYIRDSGLLNVLLRIRDEEELISFPKLGFLWEGFVIEEVIRMAGERNCFFWAVHNGAGIDLVVFDGGKKIGIECKYSDAPGITKSTFTALKDLSLDYVYVVYPGRESYMLDEKIEVLAFGDMHERLMSRRAGRAGRREDYRPQTVD